ncbi:hypothetical protein K7R23_21495 [Citrobacter rodentium NBRC 105723 = DSM 16636]|uniref:Uncharacterized protein n=1 Tax=Citrobacter rodentium TaxID=67825 RepID=A0A482PHS8_CITRO|nr:hypothetical protein [Citrobacter rodentium]QBY27599.1 hypothetical protein E2R62_01255 [Citrobacter rodentium]UHO33624.1 hypothetical protein K7R23_21495 [Citrobacter rodentium NBRC 105723 = DSM 16636]HAT8012238.1 hypothetical protein [Citrobacter rodentium NBRC 105723 = DSM 16636]HAT8017289.1 hypothetical protein [Citrobacter rodentium]HAT8026992.1 hypothetical protein [Citrobacter rodentium]
MPVIHCQQRQIVIFSPYNSAALSKIVYIAATISIRPLMPPITQIVNKIAVLFFYAGKFPTIQPIACQQQ